MVDLSAIIVNYNSGWYCTNLVDSLLDQDFETPHGKPGKLEIIVVDNASHEDQRVFLDPLKEKGVRIHYADTNTGYAGGNNLGMLHAAGDWILICNPDVVLLPGSLQTLLEVLYSDPRIGMVGPRGWLDPGFHFYLPPVEMPTLGSHLYEATGRILKPIGKSYSLTRSRYALRYWSGDGTLEADVISGFCFLMPSSLAKKMGPFDPGFPFYYEDDDLCYRLTKAGYQMRYVKDAPAIHFYNKSAGPVFDEVVHKYYRSKSYFFKKHYGQMGHFFYCASTKFLRKNINRFNGSYFEGPKDLGKLERPPEIDCSSSQPMVVELTLDPAFVLAAGHIHPGGPYCIPDPTWNALDANTYYLRLLDPSCRKSLSAYKWEKTTPGILPPSYAELKEMIP